MRTYAIGKTFESLEECTKWEETNFADRSYNGEPILMVSHTETMEGKVTIDSVTTC